MPIVRCVRTVWAPLLIVTAGSVACIGQSEPAGTSATPPAAGVRGETPPTLEPGVGEVVEKILSSARSSWTHERADSRRRGRSPAALRGRARSPPVVRRRDARAGGRGHCRRCGRGGRLRTRSGGLRRARCSRSSGARFGPARRPAADRALFDLGLSIAGARILRAVRNGRVDPATMNWGYTIERKPVDPHALLKEVREGKGLPAVIESLEPPVRHYARAKRALAAYRSFWLRPARLTPCRNCRRARPRWNQAGPGHGLPQLVVRLRVLGDLQRGGGRSARRERLFTPVRWSRPSRTFRPGTASKPTASSAPARSGLSTYRWHNGCDRLSWPWNGCDGCRRSAAVRTCS